MRNWKIKLTGTLMTLALLVSLVSLLAVPATAAVNNAVYFDPNPAVVAQCCQSVDVKLMVNIAAANPAAATRIIFSFDNTCLEITEAVGNTADWDKVTIPELDEMDSVNTAGSMTITSSVGEAAALSGTYEIATLTLHCINCDGCTSALDLTLGEYTTEIMETIDAVLMDGEFTCGGQTAKELVSGTMEPDSALDAYPAGFVPLDDFAPGQDVCVWGSGFLPDMDYKIYIQPYQEGVAVAEGDTLTAGAAALLGYTEITVPANPDGTLGPVYLFTAAEEHICYYWEIVADDLGGACPGVYNEAEDGLDAVSLNDYGFHVVPEALTIILLGGGLAGLGGYVAARRRKSSLNHEE
jgi:hypothetical protein